jgi:HK97 family phage portal protein
MGFLDRLLARSDREKFAQWSIADKAFAGWLLGTEDGSIESVTPTTVLGLSAVLRAVSVISTTIAGLPLRTYERQGEDRVRVPSVFDDPYPGIDGMTPFAWVETVLIHLLLWREAFLWHEARDAQGFVTVYRPILPDAFTVKRVGGKRVFTFTDSDTNEKREVGSEQITYIPGPSLDGVRGHPLLHAARAVFSAAISGDKTAQVVLRRGIRLAGLVTPADPRGDGDSTDFDETEGKAILEMLRSNVVGRENAGDVAVINRRLKLQPWTPNNIESQWHETRGDVLGEIGRLFGLPPHLLNDTEKQTSWGTGVAEQNLGLQRYTLMGWSTRIEQVLKQRLPRDQFVEFDYKGLLQGTPAQEIELLIAQKDAGVLTVDEVRKIMNLPPLTTAQKAELAPPPAPRPLSMPNSDQMPRQEATA